MSDALKNHFGEVIKLNIDDQVQKMMDQYFPKITPKETSEGLNVTIMAKQSVIKEKLKFSLLNTREEIDSLKLDMIASNAKKEYSEALQLCKKVEGKMNGLIGQTMNSDNYDFGNIDIAA